MANLDNILQKAKELAGMAIDASAELYKSAEEKTKLFAKTTKLKSEITKENGSLKKLYAEIGMKFYSLHKENPDPDFEQAFSEVAMTLDKIAEKTAELEELKAAAESGDSGDFDFETEADDSSEDCGDDCGCEDSTNAEE